MIPLTQGSHSAESSPTMSRLFPPADDPKRRHSLLLAATTTGSDVTQAGSGLLSSMVAATSAAAFVAALTVPDDNANQKDDDEVTRDDLWRFDVTSDYFDVKKDDFNVDVNTRLNWLHTRPSSIDLWMET